MTLIGLGIDAPALTDAGIEDTSYAAPQWKFAAERPTFARP